MKEGCGVLGVSLVAIRMSILLIRHGETASNLARIVQLPETPLSARGVAQAERLAARIAALGIAAIRCSDHARALMTAEPVRRATAVPMTVDAGLRERNYGALRGRPYADVGDIFAPDLEPSGGESWAVFHARVGAMWPEVVAQARATPGNLAVITHGLVLYSLGLYHLRLPPGAEVPLRWGNTALTVVDPTAPFTVRLLNCTAHLDDGTANDGRGVSGL